MLNFLIKSFGSAIIVAGLEKLSGAKGYRHAFGGMGWSQAGMKQLGLMEIIGGALSLASPTARLGGLIIALASGLVLKSELKYGESKLAVPRMGIMGLASLLTMVAKKQRGRR